VANTVGKLTGKSAMMIQQKYERQRNFVGLNFWSRCYCVSTVGLDEAVIREYIRPQEEREKQKGNGNSSIEGTMAGPNRPLIRGLPQTTRSAGST
jgi:Transposase IS200 like